MNRNTGLIGIIAIVLVSAASVAVAQTPDRFIGRWALTIPGGGAGWLSIEDKGRYFDGAVLWGGGSVVPLDSVYFDGETLNVTRVRKVERKNKAGKVVRTQNFTETITATVSGDTMKLTRIAPKRNGKGASRETFTGKRIKPLGAKPDLSKAKRGKAVKLFNGKDLKGWKLIDWSKNRKNGWSVKNGVLTNNPVQPEGRHIRYGNLRTVAEFEDFNIKLEVKVGKGNNSGVYLRGIYEVQVTDSFGKGLDSHNMAAVYSRIAPVISAEKPAGKWQTLDITLLERHITVILNGKTVIDNQPLPGCTGGALWSDESRPGPIYLQGDHTGINYRNIVLTPLMK
ncbi:MAG: DUF1080 domain-containing protein [Planctomycetes bacterium]|nr:DUF1080 domain-containing protein [Planctomycetota bacterium]